MKSVHDLAALLFRIHPDKLTETQRHVLRSTVNHELVSRDVNETYRERLSFGDRLADNVARFGGSWRFIVGFCVFLALWAIYNVWLTSHPYDPYPFIFLNLVLSMLAAIQAPIIMMAQNRQAQRDRIDATHDYEVNLKAEIEIMALHDKLDQIRNNQLVALLGRIEVVAKDIQRLESDLRRP